MNTNEVINSSQASSAIVASFIFYFVSFNASYYFIICSRHAS